MKPLKNNIFCGKHAPEDHWYNVEFYITKASVQCSLPMWIPSILNVMESTLKSCSFGCLKGEEEWSCLLVNGIVCWPHLGVLTSSVFRVSDPWWLMVWTSFNSCKVPFGITIFGLEENDILARGKVWQHLGIEGWINPHMEKKTLTKLKSECRLIG